ncbi:26363_t:CDS:1, partial [Dentiscutata erythropus]
SNTLIQKERQEEEEKIMQVEEDDFTEKLEIEKAEKVNCNFTNALVAVSS